MRRPEAVQSEPAEKWRGNPRLLSFLLVLLPLAIGCWLLLERLGDPLWHDEIYTLERFATGDARNAFLDYSLPNNHILFSAVYGWLRALLGLTTGEPVALRLLLLPSFLAGIVLFFLACRREFGAAGAGLAALLLATSHPVLLQALQIRGYGPSLALVALALLLLPDLRRKPLSWRRGVLFGCAGTLCVGILPTNLLAFAVFPAWLLIDAAFATEKTAVRALLLRLAAVGLPPLLGLLFLVPVWSQVPEALRHGAATTLAELARGWPLAALRDFWWLLPLALLPLFWRDSRRQGMLQLALLLAALLVPLLLILPLPAVPNSRVLYPVLPLVLAPLAAGAGLGLRQLLKTRVWLGYALVAAALIVCGDWRERTQAGFASRYPPDRYVYDLYDHSHLYRFPFLEAIAAAQTELQRAPAALVLTNGCDALTFFWYYQRRMPPELARQTPLFWQGQLSEARPLAFLRGWGRPVVVVASGEDAARALAQQLFPDAPFRLMLARDCGILRVYRLSAAGR